MSEVGIDKVMADISSFRQRLAMLREELGRANRSMADKMSQLGETLTQRVRDLRDQVTTAPQELALDNEPAGRSTYNSGTSGSQHDGPALFPGLAFLA